MAIITLLLETWITSIKSKKTSSQSVKKFTYPKFVIKGHQNNLQFKKNLSSGNFVNHVKHNV